MKKISRGLGVIGGASLLLLAVPVPASAHPTVVSRTPEDGASVSQPPSEVSVEFDEIVTNADLDVFDPCGSQVDNGDPQALGRTVSVGMSADKAGTYSVDWVVISEDGHNVRGSWTFTSTGGSACPGAGGGTKGGGTGGDSGGTDGSGGDGSGGDGSTGGGDAQEPATGGSGGSVQASGDNGGKHGDHNGAPGDKDGKKKKNKHENHTSNDGTRDVDLISEDRNGGSDPSDIPVDWLLISFGIAAIIGASAGSIYASIMGPR